MTYLNFPTPAWMLAFIVALLIFVVVHARVHGALAFFLTCAYNAMIIRMGPITLVPVAFGALAVAFIPKGRLILGTYIALAAWVLLRGYLGLQESAVDLQALLYLVVFINLIPFVLAAALDWNDRAVADFAKGIVAGVVLQMVVVWSRAMDAGLAWSSWVTDFWLTQWSDGERSPFVLLTGITNYHWYSWNLGLAAMAVLFVLRTRQARHRVFYLAAACLFMIMCIQQVAVVGSRQSITSLIVAVLATSWSRVRKALLNVGVFLIVAGLALAALRVLADLEPLPTALMHGADTVAEAFDPTVSRGSEWQKGLQIFVQSPVIGVGFASEEGFSLGHNIVINTLANLGLIGFSLFALLIGLYVIGPLKVVLRQTAAGIDINRGLVGMQLFLVGTSMASGSVIASSGILWLGVIIVRRASHADKMRPARLRTEARVA